MAAALLWVALCPGLRQARAAIVSTALAPVGDVTTWPGGAFRWKDIAGNLYAADYRSSFTYESPSVSLTFDDQDPLTLRGEILATGLKPNFAYQMKLVGRPTKLWGSEGDDLTNERLGFSGRWWRERPNPGNADDAEYLAKHDDPAYIFEGYLLFDFFVTDAAGSAVEAFSVDSSFHVLFTTSQRPRAASDSSPVTQTVYSDESSPAYDGPLAPTDVTVYAQWEPGRALPQELVLPAGPYRTQFILTEESFHDSGLGGHWATALGAPDVSFVLGGGDGNCAAHGGDRDGDGICSDTDDCPGVANPGQEDADADGLGDSCDGDDDNDGFSDEEEEAAGCNPLDGREIPPQPVLFAGGRGRGSDAVLTFSSPDSRKVRPATHPSCAPSGVCTAGRCAAGRIGDPCTSHADCDPAVPGTCRVVVNYAKALDLRLVRVRLNRTDVTSAFLPATPGCSRKVEIALDPRRRTNRLRLAAVASRVPTGRRPRRDRDTIIYR